MKKVFSFVVAIVIGSVFISGVASAAAPFYEGKTIRIVVGLSAGGGYDLWARLIARHFGKYIPGNPTVIVENMTGAGGLIATNYIYKAAKPDGLTIGHPSGLTFSNQLFGGPGVEFDARKFEYIGAPYQDENVVFTTKKSGITSVDKWRDAKTPVKFGGEAPGAGFSDAVPNILAKALGFTTKVVLGYKGTSEAKLAVDTGELDGLCLGWVSGKSVWRQALEKGDVIPILQVVSTPIPELPNVPLAINYAKTDDARRLINFGIYKPVSFARPYILPPGTPKERLQILRDAFEATLKDKELMAEAQKARMEIRPLTGENLEKAIQDLFNLDTAMVGKLKDIIYMK